MIFRAPSSKTAYCDPIFSFFLQPGKAENETNGPKPFATMSNKIDLPITCDLGDYRHLSRKKLGDF